jgi:leucyl-tRNA synthetase
VCFVGRVFYAFEIILWALQVTEEIEGMRFNTAISAMMEFINAATKVQYSDLAL